MFDNERYESSSIFIKDKTGLFEGTGGATRRSDEAEDEVSNSCIDPIFSSSFF
jgi:hypothetical protein